MDRALTIKKMNAIITKHGLTREEFYPAYHRVLSIREIRHAFEDAFVNVFGETEDERRTEFREMLEMHTGITQERYGFSDDEMTELVIEVATENGIKETYDWAYGIA